jgi:uncharacterized repeat protein (TIGR03803 family)
MAVARDTKGQKMQKILSGLRSGLLGCGMAFVFLGGAHANSFAVIHSFAGGINDGAGPLSGVAPAPHGDFYVATDGGGASGLGTLTLVRRDGSAQILHSFTGDADGQNADSTPFRWSDGSLYATTQFGGASGCGTVYRYIPGSPDYQQLQAFLCAPDGAFPFAGLADSGKGYLLGTGYNGGDDDDGTLIFVDLDGYSSSSCQLKGSDGAHPFAGITMANGNIYTVTTAGGAANLGTVTEFDPANCATTVLHSFTGGSDGATPYGSLFLYKNVLYGTTSFGGDPNLGTAFRINPDGSGYTVLHTFQGIDKHLDGSFPHGGLALNEKDGMLFGTTINGGSPHDLGMVFKLNPKTGAENIVHAFSGSDGAHPYGNLYIKKNTIYGTTGSGGASNLGEVFKVKL